MRGRLRPVEANSLHMINVDDGNGPMRPIFLTAPRQYHFENRRAARRAEACALVVASPQAGDTALGYLTLRGVAQRVGGMALSRTVCVAVMLVGLAAPPAHGSMFVVNDLGDAGDASADAVCATAASTCTLRAALDEANRVTDSGCAWLVLRARTSSARTSCSCAGANSSRAAREESSAGVGSPRYRQGVTPAEVIDQIKARLAAAVPPQSQVLLFGSRAREDANDASDFDVLVIEKTVVDPAAESVRLRAELRGLGVPIDVVVVDAAKAERRRTVRGTVVERALREGRLLVDA